MLSRFTADPEIAFAWETAQTTKLTASQQSYFKQLAGHELGERQFMAQGIPYRNPQSWDPEFQMFNPPPPGAHDLAPAQPNWGTFDGFMDYFNKNF
ncbi:hypothetical protein [Aliikangiella maris]|uniref:Uncharacterized protein n=2 Tax=Aliikangiella maris TaxID=3162458 RepID=A0ABV3MS89_9GAMM